MEAAEFVPDFVAAPDGLFHRTIRAAADINSLEKMSTRLQTNMSHLFQDKHRSSCDVSGIKMDFYLYFWMSVDHLANARASVFMLLLYLLSLAGDKKKK